LYRYAKKLESSVHHDSTALVVLVNVLQIKAGLPVFSTASFVKGDKTMNLWLSSSLENVFSTL
jgi:hypothetical protein